MYLYYTFTTGNNNKQKKTKHMKLTKNHREALLALLEQTNNQITTFKGWIESYKEDVRMAEHFEMNHYLEQERKATIEKALIDNEIDY